MAEPDVSLSPDLLKEWKKSQLIKALSAKEIAPKHVPPTVTLKRSGCFRFDDGTTKNWTLDQLYDAETSPLKKVPAYFPFVLHNSQNLALAASVSPLLVTDPNCNKCDIYFDSPDLSSNADWQGISGYSLDVYRLLASLCGDFEELYRTQLQLVLIDSTDNSEHTFGEYDETNNTFISHPIKLATPYHFVWKPSVLSNSKYKVKKLRVRMTMPGYLGPGGGECAPRGKWLIGNVCPEK
jgi:hypothetical protein